MQTLQQKYAASVYKKVSDYEKDDKSKSKENSKKYGAMALKLPILIHTAGLAQALAFVQSRDKDPFTQLLKDLAEVVGTITKNNYSVEAFVNESRSSELEKYTYLTKHTMTALEWFKRYAQSILKVETTDVAED